MKKAFSLVEIMIVVAILGILAAVVLPEFKGHSQKAKESAAKDNLRTIRSIIEVYAAQHNGTPPACLNNEAMPVFFLYPQLTSYTDIEGTVNGTKTEKFKFGPYLRKFPENPFNNSSEVTILKSDKQFPEVPDGSSGWIYKPTTKVVRIDYPGTDSEDKAYYDY